MMLLFLPSQLDLALRRGGWYLIIGFPLLFVLGALGTRFSFLQHQTLVSPMMATAYGAGCGTFCGWRTDKGLWMLAVAFLLMFFPIYAVFALMEYFGSTAEVTVGQMIDFSLATIVVGKLCRLLLSIAVLNWRIHRATAV